MTALEIGVALPTVGAEVERLGAGGVAAAARHVEQLGLSSVWVPDLVAGDGTPSLEATVALTAAATATEHVRVGFSVLVLPLRPVAWTAAQIQGLQHLSGNRVVLGVGAGGFPGTPFWQAVGGPARGRGRATDEALAVLPGLIAGEPTRLPAGSDGPVLTLAPAAPVPPILIGGLRDSHAGLRRAATYGHGWFPSLLTPDALAAGAETVRELAAERGRPDPTVAFGAHAVLGDDRPAREESEALVRSMGDDHGIAPDEAARVLVTGSPREAAERFAAYAAAGADHLVVAPPGGDWMRRCELIAEARALLG